MHTTLVLDFDSTLVSVETLDILAEVALEGNPHKKNILDEVTRITRKGMEGRIPFEESLSQRIAKIPLTKQHCTQVAHILKEKITPSVRRQYSFFSAHRSEIYVVSGGFGECMGPALHELGIAPNHVFANTFRYDQSDTVIGVDLTNPLARNGGKSAVVRSLVPKRFTVMVGDGYTDLEVKLFGAADRFIAYTECINRAAVSGKADHIARTFADVITYYNSV